MAHQVFLSHSAGDKPIADAICARLESERIRVWIAPRDILAGQDWEEAIANAIRACRLMVLVFSSKANLSQHVKREVDIAIRSGKTIVPFRIEDVQPSGALEYQLGTIHWLDAITPPMETHLNRLVGTVSQILAGPDAEIPLYSRAATAVYSEPRKSHGVRNVALGVGAVFAVIIAAVALSNGSKNQTPVPYHRPPDPVLEKAKPVSGSQGKPDREPVTDRQSGIDPNDALVPAPKPKPPRPSTVYGDWTGLYSCPPQGNQPISFHIYERGPGHADAIVTYSALQAGTYAPVSGSYRAHVDFYNPSDGSIQMHPEQWISQPFGAVASGFNATVNQSSGVMQGTTICGTFRLVRQGSASQE